IAGDPRVIAMQDLGAAGLSGSTSEMAHRGGLGIDIDVLHVSRREQHMTPYEVMLSESQERMLVLVKQHDVAWLRTVFDRWDLNSDVIGTIIEEPSFVIREGADVVCHMPLDVVVDGAPTPMAPSRILHGPGPTGLVPELHWSHSESLLRLLGSSNIGSRRSVFRRYDHQVGDATIVKPGGDAAVVRVDGTRRGLALSTDGPHRDEVWWNSRTVAANAVCEAARNVVAVGAQPIGVTNCLNFANPEHALTYYALKRSIEGITEACTALGVPVVSGNVSLYNQGDSSSIPPTPVIGMVGLVDDVERICTAAFAGDGDVVALSGPLSESLEGSELACLVMPRHGAGESVAADLPMEVAVQSFVLACIRDGLLRSAHDVADGGFAVALAECCVLGARGCVVALDEIDTASDARRVAGILFGESQSRFVLSLPRDNLQRVSELAARHGAPFRGIGSVGGDRIIVTGAIDIAMSDATAAYDGALTANA
ncbi:MAG: phosphoribosylformylglycinamidine synthase II, partial [Candidatus Dormibacteraeota bacterium]|nr:phosphoribosylformylglycinamidine synthase II [Candidatus Dormibacteraeota bacterium]